MGLTQKILLFVSLIVVALVVVSLAYTTFQADRLAHENIDRALIETRGVWETFQTDRYNKLKLGVRVLANDSPFKAAMATDQATVYDMLQERGQDLGADFFIATDPVGVVVARSDRPGASGADLSRDPVVMKPLEGEESATVWQQDGRLYHAVSVPMQFGPDVVGVLIAGYGISEGLAGNIRKLTHSEIAYLTRSPGQAPSLSVSTLGPKEEAFRAALHEGPLASGEETATPFELNLAGDRHVAVQVPLKAATGETVGSVVALRSLGEEMASFRRFRNSLVVVSLIVMGAALGLAYVASSRITGPVRKLADLVERARSGSYTGAVTVDTGDEIGILARNFNSLLADLRQKEQMIGFLREGLTMMKKRGEATTVVSGAGDPRNEATSVIDAVTAPASPSAIQKGSLFDGRYEILGTVGKGGMGVVYRARDRKLDEVVALKVLRREMMIQDETLLERFKQEIKLARKISHRNVLRTHDFGEWEGTPYISMEYLEGVTLKDLVKNKGALPSGVGLSIAKQMCQGLEAAHHQGVVHRDIKPQNMLILPESGELKVMDFGIARVSSMEAGASGLTTAGTVMGTPDYMPPEQAQGGAADFRSDIYSLGVVFYEIFTGKLPFTGDTIMKIILGHIQTPPVPPRKTNPRILPELEAIVLRCMAKSPDDRYQKVEEILDGLSEVSSRADASAA